MLEEKRVLITGGTGFVGRCLQDEIAVSVLGCDVVIARRAPANSKFGRHLVWDLINDELPCFKTELRKIELLHGFV